MKQSDHLSIQAYEIMAPVGSRESLAAAIQAGADSIYFGIENLNMRARSANTFSIDDLREIARTCDEHGMKRRSERSQKTDLPRYSSVKSPSRSHARTGRHSKL